MFTRLVRTLLWLAVIVLAVSACSPGEPATAAATSAPSLTAASTLPPTETPAPAAEITLSPPVPTATPGCAETAGQVSAHSFHSPALGEDWAVQVYTPPCFTLAADPRPAVLILLHGQGGSDAQWPNFGLAETADALIAAGEIEPLVIVTPNERRYLQDVFESTYRQAVVEDLLPWIDAELAPCAGRECWSIGGLSRGASWSARIAFERADLFGAVGLHSFPGFIGDPARLGDWLGQLPAGETLRVYMDIGADDPYLRYAVEFERRLTDLGAAHTWQLNPGGHIDAYWTEHLADYLRFYSPPAAP